MENRVSLNAFRSKLLNSRGTMDYDSYEGQWPDVTLTFRFAHCQQCDAAPCVEVCPTGASVKRDDGVVTVDKDVCIGCESCLAACPYDARTIDEEAHVAEKCDMCLHRIEQGEIPMCEYSCPARALTSGDFDDPNSAVSKLVAEKDAFRLLEERGTGPNVYYL